MKKFRVRALHFISYQKIVKILLKFYYIDLFFFTGFLIFFLQSMKTCLSCSNSQPPSHKNQTFKLICEKI